NKTLVYLWGRIPFPRRVRTALIWLLSPKFTVGVVALVLDEEGRVLLLRHTYRRSRPWGLPGGGLKPGETLEECLKREMREEAGMEIEIDSFLSAAAHRDRRLVDMIFSCRPAAGQSLATFRANSEISEAGFYPPDALPEGVSSAQRTLIATALRQAQGDRSIKYIPSTTDPP
ncbi:MAG TPA: NUDIX domain-containing protein, partial [Chloroflexia bacterium]|nr:NUDIX domain-containing protein [Chloroflexia bacterium]